MMRMTVILVVLTFAYLSPAVGDDAEVVAKFKEFAESENSRSRATFESMAGKFIVEPTGMALPLTMPRKYMFSGMQLEAAPSTYSYDVRRTDSLVTPFIGTIEWPLVFLRATTHTKGPAEFCNAKPLNVCLEHGGKIVETSLLKWSTEIWRPFPAGPRAAFGGVGARKSAERTSRSGSRRSQSCLGDLGWQEKTDDRIIRCGEVVSKAVAKPRA